MKLLRDSKEINGEFARLMRKYKYVSFGVAWASTGFSGYDLLVRQKNKIKKGIVGIHFYQTDPNFIDHFRTDKRVLFVKQPNGVFHPKIYLFENSPSAWECLLGSANFTNGGFNSNNEMCVVFGDGDDEKGDVKAGLDRQLGTYWEMGESFNEDDLKHYRLLHKRARERIKPFGENKRGRPILNTPILTKSWKEFYDEVCHEEYHNVTGRIELLTTVRQWFEKYHRYSSMPEDIRKAIAGTGGGDGMPDWGWFGRMFGAGRFKNRVKENDTNLSLALDAIPLEGEVREEHYTKFIENYRKAFPKELGHGLGTATRLLAMKRPDYFVCLDKANRVGLCNAFEITLSNHDYDGYWNLIVERMFLSQWWNSTRPTADRAMKVWDGRAAFLDSLYYVPQ